MNSITAHSVVHNHRALQAVRDWLSGASAHLPELHKCEQTSSAGESTLERCLAARMFL
jgi:hypothetical protein